MKKNIIFIFTTIFLLTLISFTSASLGCFKQGDAIPIVTSLLANNVTITQITTPTPNPYIIVRNQLMEKNGNSFNWTFGDTKILGEYTYGYCDDLGNCYGNNFFITPSGTCGSSNIAFFIVVILLIYGITLWGFFGKSVPMTIMGGMAMLFLGIYLFNNGVIIYRDDITRYISYVTIGIGAILAIWASYEWYQDM